MGLGAVLCWKANVCCCLHCPLCLFGRCRCLFTLPTQLQAHACRLPFRPSLASRDLPPAAQVLDGVLREIATALLQADVNVRLVANLR